LRALALPLLYRPQQLIFSFRKEKKLKTDNARSRKGQRGRRNC
jgi:hypothetical protein